MCRGMSEPSFGCTAHCAPGPTVAHSCVDFVYRSERPSPVLQQGYYCGIEAIEQQLAIPRAVRGSVEFLTEKIQSHQYVFTNLVELHCVNHKGRGSLS
jgi:hypothetical protein